VLDRPEQAKIRVLFLFQETFFVSSTLSGKESVDPVSVDFMVVTTFNEKLFQKRLIWNYTRADILSYIIAS